MRVITFDQQQFDSACAALARICIDAGCRPDCLVGIRNGGSYVAAAMETFFPQAVRFDVDISRPTTRHKGAAFRMMVSSLSRPLQDFMRKTESRVRSLLHAERRRVRATELSEGLSAYLSNHPQAQVLVVDDAIDSGITMARVLKTFSSRFPALRITTAVITVTTTNPATTPDFTLHNNQTLIRFPWSSDAK